MKKMFALGGILAAPFVFLALPQVPKIVFILVNILGFSSPGTTADALTVAVATWLGGLLGGGNLILGAFAVL